jgi:kinesin family member 2/24
MSPTILSCMSLLLENQQIEKNREDRRKAMAAAKREREMENLQNEKRGQPGDVDFQRMIKAFREQHHDKHHAHAVPGETKITICVRKRPVNAKETKRRDYDAVTCLNPAAIVHYCKLKVDGITKYLDSNAFQFDHTFDEATSNETVYKYTAQPLVQFVFQDKGRATVFAYGQTGSGKTHTMQGIQRQIANDVFAQVHASERHGVLLDVCVSFFEIYGGRCQDLLHNKKCTIREDGNGEVQIQELEEVKPSSVDELLQVIQKGNSLRTTHATEMNDVSSRSHCICQISIRERGKEKLHGKLSLIDLAGSERGEDTKNHNRTRRMESSEINKSLLALKECFRALDSGGRNAHIPFRASKLTQVLKDSFVNAKARTVMIAAVSPVSSSADHTLNTLRYADRVKEKHVAANAFAYDEASAVDLGDVSLDDATGGIPEQWMCIDIDSRRFRMYWTEIDEAAEEGLSPHPDDEQEEDEELDFDDDGPPECDAPCKEADQNGQHELRLPYRSNSASSQEDIKLLHDSLRRHQFRVYSSPLQSDNKNLRVLTMILPWLICVDGSGPDTATANDYDLENLHGVVQTLYEEQEGLLYAHMNAIQVRRVDMLQENRGG